MYYKRLSKATLVIIWSSLLFLGLYYMVSIDFDFTTLANDLIKVFTSPLGVILFLILFAVRPFLLIPASILGILAGFLYDFWPAVFIVLIGAVLANVLAYYVGMGLTPESLKKRNFWGIKDMFKRNSFEAVLICRLVYVPDDLLSYVSGASHINFKNFLLATIIGTIPFALIVASFGSSIESTEEIENFSFSLNPEFIVLGFVFLGASLVLSYFMRKKFKVGSDPIEGVTDERKSILEKLKLKSSKSNDDQD